MVLERLERSKRSADHPHLAMGIAWACPIACNSQ